MKSCLAELRVGVCNKHVLCLELVSFVILELMLPGQRGRGSEADALWAAPCLRSLPALWAARAERQKQGAAKARGGKLPGLSAAASSCEPSGASTRPTRRSAAQRQPAVLQHAPAASASTAVHRVASKHSGSSGAAETGSPLAIRSPEHMWAPAATSSAVRPPQLTYMRLKVV